jgi:hypothetical protein
MHVRFAVISAALAIVFAIMPAYSDDVPQLNVDPVCHGIAQQAAGPGEKGGPDLAFAQCVKNEQAMRQKLIGEWSTFVPSETSNCIGEETSASLPSYTDLVTCLEMAKAARWFQPRLEVRDLCFNRGTVSM